MWTLEQAQKLIAELEPAVRELHYHTLLGGGVLHRGSSDKDLDIWFMPLNGYECDSRPIVRLLFGVFAKMRPLRDSPDYVVDALWHLQDAYVGEYNGKRVDLFIQ